jgi:hypothetical protein
MSKSIAFSSDTIAHNFSDVRVHFKLTDLILWIVDFTGEIVITSARRYRTIHAKDSGIHLTDPLRAVDCRYFVYNNPDKLVDIINANWLYDPRRKSLNCSVLHNPLGGLNKHIHLQVHERTKQIT